MFQFGRSGWIEHRCKPIVGQQRQQFSGLSWILRGDGTVRDAIFDALTEHVGIRGSPVLEVFGQHLRVVKQGKRIAHEQHVILVGGVGKQPVLNLLQSVQGIVVKR